jgi:Kdo2-lipid IVA lauroyltransferase/acyltransferase
MAERRLSPVDWAEGIGAVLLYAFFRLLPLDWASGLGGFLARGVGPHFGISKRARENLRLALPELGPDEHARIIREMWDNLGRIVAEYPHLGKFRLFEKNGRVEVVDGGNLLGGRIAGKRYIFFSAHCGNWEIATRAATQAGFEVTGIYRAPNNPIVDRLITWARGTEGGELIPKGTIAARQAFAALHGGRELCMLIDQKMNDGIPVPFFGRDAMTAPALALLALRYDCAVVPVRVVRLKGAHFRIISEPPLDLPHGGDATADRLQLMTEVNAAVERWVREYPAQWLWLHRRWPDA